MGKRTADSTEVSKRLKDLRKNKGIRSQRELSNLSRVSYISIGRYERGETVPEGNNLFKLANFFKVDPEYILGTTDFFNKFDKWNKTSDLDALKEDIKFWDKGISQGLLPCIRSDDEYSDFIAYVKHFEERKGNMKTRNDVTVIINETKNQIIDDFETGEIKIYATSEDQVEKAFQQLINRGMIQD